MDNKQMGKNPKTLTDNERLRYFFPSREKWLTGSNRFGVISLTHLLVVTGYFLRLRQ